MDQVLSQPLHASSQVPAVMLFVQLLVAGALLWCLFFCVVPHDFCSLSPLPLAWQQYV